MWSAVSLALLLLGGVAIYAGWALTMSSQGMSLALLLAGVPLLYCAIVFAIMAVYFAAAWLYRAERPPQAQIGIAATWRLVGNEYWALLGSAWRTIFYKWLVRDPPPAPAHLPVLLLHGVLCNAGVWSRFARLLDARGVRPVYTISYGPPLASIDLFADQLAQKIDDILSSTGASSLVIVAHSMGGLVALAYCRKYGASKIRRLISLATPYRGSVPRNVLSRRVPSRIESAERLAAPSPSSRVPDAAGVVDLVVARLDGGAANLLQIEGHAEHRARRRRPQRDIGGPRRIQPCRCADLCGAGAGGSRRAPAGAYQ
jgi:pimeloyl-ACP methyl ester carboxylesterase